MKRIPNKLIDYQPIKRPATIEVAIEERLDRFDLDIAQRDPEHFARRMKDRMAARIARYIVENARIFEVPTLASLQRDPSVRLQCTINDYGAYAAWIPEARNEGFKDGAKHMQKLIPYGVEPGLQYE